jgi:hypothetical protein
LGGLPTQRAHCVKEREGQSRSHASKSATAGEMPVLFLNMGHDLIHYDR